DQAMEKLVTVRTQVGARLNEIDSQQDINANIILYAQQNLSQAQDLDYAEAIGRMELELLGLQASQQAFIKMQGLSLFNYL
ncbi:MAG: flagellar hook-associated protein 3, partial [Gammaproteobacteria bacterium]|nr:flagellar hook-associated protein 3 [Gammaproteobacteria bacterium]